VRLLLAWAHLMGLGIGLGAVPEVAPMVALVRWRLDLKHGRVPDTRPARTSTVQAVLVILMVLCAAAMARGIRFPG